MRSVAVAYILWFFFGVLGVHRFYCRRVVSGVIWLLTGGVLGIGWLVDVFLVPDLVRQANLEDQVGQHDQMLHDPGRRQGDTPPRAHQAAPGHRVIYCTHCGSAMQVPLASGGGAYGCPSCKRPVTVPA